jgi:hypothetical protein
MLESKAQLMAQTIDSGTIDQVKEQLALLSQFKDSFVKVQNRIDGKGEDDFVKPPMTFCRSCHS